MSPQGQASLYLFRQNQPILSSGIYHGPMKIIISDMNTSNQPTYTWYSGAGSGGLWGGGATVASQGGMCTVYDNDASGLGVDLTQAVAPTKAAALSGIFIDSKHNYPPFTFRFNLYTFMQKYGGGDATIDANESWFCHNPDNSTNPSDRVAFDDGGTKFYLMRIDNAAYATHRWNIAWSFVSSKGLDGVYCDGAYGNLLIQGLNYSLGKSPTSTQINNWWYPWSVGTSNSWYAIGRSLAPAGKTIITNTSTPVSLNTAGGFAPASNQPGYTLDGDVLQHVDGTYLEFWLGFGLACGSAADWSYVRTNIVQRNINQGKYCLLNPTNNVGNTCGSPGGDNVYGIYLLDADGQYLYYGEGGGSFPGPIPGRPDFGGSPNTYQDCGVPTGPAFQNADGTWSRNFTKLTLRTNPDSSSHGGLGPWQSSYTFS